MPRIIYQDRRFSEDKLLAISRANRICEQWADQGYDLTVRQVYYQFVQRNWLSNTVRSYNWLKDLINDARMAGLIDWDHIVDRTRNLAYLAHFNDPAHALRKAKDRYQIDMWARQPTRVEVWVEKEALAGVVGQAALAHDCAYFSCRGYTSQSEMWGAAQRIGGYLRKGQNVTVLHLGDHDPSGMDMSRDIIDRLELFIRKDDVRLLSEAMWKAAEQAGYGHYQTFRDFPDEFQAKMTAMMRKAEDSWGKFNVHRIALNMDQIYEYAPPPNPAKVSDSRFRKYAEEFGDDSWELDALDPATLDALIQAHIEELKDSERWNRDVRRMETERALITAVSSNWTGVVAHVREQGWVA